MHANGQKLRDFSHTPLNVYWEMTQACALACRHCRAEAQQNAHPAELTFDEGLHLLDQIPQFGEPTPQLILTGGDPLTRTDLFPLIDEARKRGIGVSITPAATARLTLEILRDLKKHGVDGLGLSLDGSNATRHDGIRGVPGTFARTLDALRWAHQIGMPVQVNTLVAEETVDDLPAIYNLLKDEGVARWSLFFLIAVGRGRVLQPLDPTRAESLMSWIYQTSRTAPFVIATTEAPSYRRVAVDTMRFEGMSGPEIRRDPAARGFGIRDGHGIVFISHTGDICPAGFLPLVAGNIKRDNLVCIYRDSPIFRKLHDPMEFHGRCGVCEYRTLCGGSRARAFAATGDPLAQDPLCEYVPA